MSSNYGGNFEESWVPKNYPKWSNMAQIGKTEILERAETLKIGVNCYSSKKTAQNSPNGLKFVLMRFWGELLLPPNR